MQEFTTRLMQILQPELRPHLSGRKLKAALQGASVNLPKGCVPTKTKVFGGDDREVDLQLPCTDGKVGAVEHVAGQSPDMAACGLERPPKH